MASTSSSSSAQPASQDTMQIFIKTIAGETISLQVPHETTIAELTTLLQSHESLPKPLPQNFRLLHGGRHLSPASATLTSFSVRPESTISLAMPAPAPRRGLPKCDYKRDTPAKCTARIQPVVGDCGFCKGHFCSKHRLLESHNCEGLEDCKKESHERNADKLNSERTVAIKGI